MIRRAREDDWPGVRALWREIDDLHAALAPEYFRAAERAADEWRRVLRAPEGAVFVAEPAAPANGALAGVVAMRIYDTPPDPAMVPRRRAHVETLVVSAAHRRRGIGRQLMEQASAWARRQGAAELVLTVWAGNADAEQFYRRLGYGLLSQVLHMKV